MTTIAKIWLILKSNIFKMPIMTNITFLMHLFYYHQFLQIYQFYRIVVFICCLLIAFFRLVTHANTHLNKLVDKFYLHLVKSLPYFHSLPPFARFSISFLIPSKSYLYFLNTFLFSSKESKTKYLLLFFPSIVQLLHQSLDSKDLHY